MEFEHDYYSILGLPSDADEQAIKGAYRQLARRYHPDTSKEPDSSERFVQIHKAYELLSDPMRREAYDLWRRQQGLDRPQPVSLRITPSQASLPCLNEKQLLYVLIELAARPEENNARLPLNLVLVLDCSTSMRGSRLQHVKEGARFIIDQMQPQDILSLVAFNDRAEVILPGQRNPDRHAARIALNSMRAIGGTELLTGLDMGLREVTRWQSEEMHSHLILLTDGHTYGDEQGCIDFARQAREQHITLTMIGLGSDWNDRLLDEMATVNQGMSIYVDTPSRISQVFQDRMQGLDSLFAQDATLILHLAKGVVLQDAFRVSPQIAKLQFVNDAASLGALEKQQPQAIILELLLDTHEPGKHRLLQVNLEVSAPALRQEPIHAQQQLTISFECSLDQTLPVPADIVSAMGKLTLYKMQAQAMIEIEMGQIEPAVKRLNTLATRLLDIGEAELARAALLEAGHLAQTGALSSKGSKQIRYGTRGLTILPKEVRYD